jgi:Leucine-rich repeat (LRR) protein
MALVLVIGLGLGWTAHRAHVQRDAVAAIKRSGGIVAYNIQWTPVPGRPKPSGPDWVRRTLGPDFLDTVTYVNLQGARCDDQALRAACRLPWLEELVVVNTGVTDEVADDLGRLKHLRSLDFRLNRTTARPLRHIAEMSELRELRLGMKLSPVPLKDEDLAFLKRLTKLQRLMLPSADLTDKWLPYIEDLNNLEVLELYDMKITSDGLDRLKGLSKLTTLNLHGTRITSLERLGTLKKLTNLGVAYTPVDDPDLAALHGWSLLRQLDLRKTEVTDEGVAELMKANPRLKVTR